MCIPRDKIHSLNNYLNKITITCGGLKDKLQNTPLDNMAAETLRQFNSELIQAFSEMETVALDVSNILFKV